MRELSPLAAEVRRRNLTYLSDVRLEALERYATEAAKLGGDFLEAGVALGGSAVVLASHRPDGAAFRGYDVFATIPPPGERDDEHSHERYAVIASGRSEGIGGEEYYGYRPDLYAEVSQTFAEFGMPVDGERVVLVRGLFEETLHPPASVALAHIDSDWYDPVKLCLERIYPQLLDGGYVILDDYADYGGCRTATDEFMAQHPDLRVVEQPANAVLRRG